MMEERVTVHIQHADGYETQREAVDMQDVFYMLEDYACDCLATFSDDEIAQMFPMKWSAYEPGSTDIYVSGVLEEDTTVNPF